MFPYSAPPQEPSDPNSLAPPAPGWIFKIVLPITTNGNLNQYTYPLNEILKWDVDHTKGTTLCQIKKIALYASVPHVYLSTNPTLAANQNSKAEPIMNVKTDVPFNNRVSIVATMPHSKPFKEITDRGLIIVCG